MKIRVLVVLVMVSFSFGGVTGIFEKGIRNFVQSGVLNLNFFRCLVRSPNACPHPDVTFRMFTARNRRGVILDVRNPLTLYSSGFDKHRETVFIVHGFNGTERDKHIMYLRDAYLSRDYNVVTVDWKPLTYYPCYLSALANTKLASQCSAQVYAFLTYHGAVREKITCIGHSLGAHICGMVTNHLTIKQHKIIGLDPAKPLIERKKSKVFRLTKDDATMVQVIQTNAGFLGQMDSPGHLNFCINGGKFQPYCKGHPIRRSRCSHFLSICYLANAVFKHKKFLGVPCPGGCVGLSGSNRLPVSEATSRYSFMRTLREFKMGTDALEDLRGIYCLQVDFAKHCPFNEIR